MPRRSHLAQETTVSVEPAQIAIDWFARFGDTDAGYLKAHFPRFMQTKEFAIGKTRDKLNVLDVGAHWLHHAYLYAIDGHTVHCVDAPNTMRESSVIAAAQELGCSLHPAAHLEFGDGVKEIETDSIDLVLFCEILEHLTFNPIDLWSEIYRVLRAPGRIIITTPNADYWPHLQRSLQRLQAGGGWGTPVSDIMNTGTFGHHWKEYTVAEVKDYFAYLSPDFRINRYEFRQTAFNLATDLRGAPSLPTAELCHDNIFAEVTLDHKSAGLSVEPPWRAQYR